MLAVKKLDPSRDDAMASLTGGFGRVLGSIQGLQQRLGDFSYGEVSIAEAKVKMLVKQLMLLRDNLDNLARLKLNLQEVHQRVEEIPTASFEQYTVDSLAKHPQLHAILQASKLIRSANAGTAEGTVTAAASWGSVIADTPRSVPANSGTETAFEQVQPVETKQAPTAEVVTRHAGADDRVEDRARTSPSGLASKSAEPLAPANEPPNFTIPNETITALKDGHVGGQAKDWSFDLHETAGAASETSTASINFEFPAESFEGAKPEAKAEPKAKSSHTEAPSVSTAAKTALNKSADGEPQGNSAAEVNPGRPAPKKSPAKLENSKALVPANYDFDQRLLEDVIKNYGDFATTPNLPATLDSTKKTVPSTPTVLSRPAPPRTVPTNTGAAKTAAEESTHAAMERKVHNVKKSGDLDRQLKKIIKDYGEYDIYQRKSVVSFKTGGAIAFAVLGLVLAMLYLFKPSAAVSTSPTGAVTPPQAAERSYSTQTSGVKDAANTGTTTL